MKRYVCIGFRAPNMPYLNAYPEHDVLHDDPRFLDLLRRMGLPR